MAQNVRQRHKYPNFISEIFSEIYREDELGCMAWSSRKAASREIRVFGRGFEGAYVVDGVWVVGG